MTEDELLAVQMATDRGCDCHPEVTSIRLDDRTTRVHVTHPSTCRLARVDSASQN